MERLLAVLFVLCRELGIESVAVYSQADKDALHVQLADHAVCIGPAASKDSYLKVENILSAAVITGRTSDSPRIWILIGECQICQNVCGMQYHFHWAFKRSDFSNGG